MRRQVDRVEGELVLGRVEVTDAIMQCFILCVISCVGFVFSAPQIKDLDSQLKTVPQLPFRFRFSLRTLFRFVERVYLF
jgi:hypothetical protein